MSGGGGGEGGGGDEGTKMKELFYQYSIGVQLKSGDLKF